ncbi:Crp/Fnr family transcriptional regulator [Shewanella sp. GXUN23E]|uniref:Crp/Fnr family transcriptional regulator n=1 Tax=Shewanella sp. GXUN23E TaxID=3422498 RepID=UPI003D7E55FC
MPSHHSVILSHLLQRIVYLGGEPTQSKQFVENCIIMPLTEGDIFCRRGESKGLAYLAEGAIVTRHNFGEGLEIYSSNRTADNFVITAIENLQPAARSDFICLEPGIICYWKAHVLQDFIHSNQQFHNNILQLYLYELSIISELGYLRSMLNKRDYAILTMLLMFSSNAKRTQPSYQVSQQIMCNHTGMTRQYYGKLLSELEHKNVIKCHYKHIHLLSYEKLRSELSIDILDHFIGSFGFNNIQ